MSSNQAVPTATTPKAPNLNWWMLCVTLMFFIVPFQLLLVFAALQIEAEWLGIVAVTSMVFGVINIFVWLYQRFEDAVDRSAAKNQ